jgi:hypothetical protein
VAHSYHGTVVTSQDNLKLFVQNWFDQGQLFFNL